MEIIQENLSDIYKKHYGRYSKAVLEDRAIPRIEDGLLPVIRRSIYTFNEINRSNVFKKAAVYVGSCMAA